MAVFRGSVCGVEFIVTAPDKADAAVRVDGNERLKFMMDEAKENDLDATLRLTELAQGSPGVFFLPDR